jgi:hypothetical protein
MCFTPAACRRADRRAVLADPDVLRSVGRHEDEAVHAGERRGEGVRTVEVGRADGDPAVGEVLRLRRVADAHGERLRCGRRGEARGEMGDDATAELTVGAGDENHGVAPG